MTNSIRENSKFAKVGGIIVAVLLFLLIGLAFSKIISNNFCKSARLSDLPTPSLSEGMRGELGIDANINESTIDNYLSRNDSVYRDMRMLKDDGNYEAIGGDSYLSGIVDGFEVTPYPYIGPLSGLPEAIGKGYTGETLFSLDKNGNYVANYEESMQILEDLFPKDKYIFLMCGGGGYSGMMKKMLVALGWDGNKIYNTGGYWYYQGEHKIEIKSEKDGKTTYDFWRLKYHEIDFSKLSKITK